MPTTLLSSPSLLSGTVFVMLLLWLCGSALMTWRVGVEHKPAPSQARSPGEPDMKKPVESPERDEEESVAGSMRLGEPQAGGTASSLAFSEGQRPMEYAGPEMVSFAASADS